MTRWLALVVMFAGLWGIPEIGQAQLKRGGGGSVAIQEADGSPSIANVSSITVTNGSLTDNGNGSATIATSGASSVTIASSPITGGTVGGSLYVATGPVLQQLTGAGLMLLNSGSAPTVYAGTTCTNQVVRLLNASGVGTCATITSSFVDTTIWTGTVASGVLKASSQGVLAQAVAGTDYVIPAGNVATATALAANGANCSAGSGALGVSAAGAAESCTDFMEEPAGNGLVARTAANTSANRTITGTSNEISVSNGDGVAGNPTLSLPSTVDLTSKSVVIPNSTTLPGTCSVGQMYMDTDATSGQRFYLCQSANTWALQGDGGGGGGGTAAGAANAVQTGNGSGTFTDSGCTAASGAMTCSGGFISSGAGAGVITLTEGTVVSPGSSAGQHNIGIDSSDSLLKSRENGGSLVTYYSTANVPTALASNGANCSAGQFPLGVDASGASENCTALPTSIAGTSNEITASGATGSVTLSLSSTLNLSSKTVRVPNSVSLPGTCTVGDMYMDTDATSGLRLYLCESTNTWTAQGSGGGTGLTSLASQTGNTQTITRGVGIGGTSATNDHSFTFDATELGDLTWGTGAAASQTWTFNNSGTDPVVVFGNGIVNVSTGNLQEGGNDVFTTGSGEINAVTAKASPTTSDLLLIEDAAASNAKKKSTISQVLSANDARTKTETNTTIDAEGTGNVLTLPRRIWLPAAGCNNATAGSVWDLPTSNPAVAACVTGTNTQKGVLDFADGSNLSAQLTYLLPSTWTGTIDAKMKWFSATTSGDVVWQLSTVCVADAETDDPSFNTASTVTDTTKGTTNQTNDASITNVTATGCAAGELLHLKIQRDSGHASDTMAGTARLVGVELVIREAI